MVNAQIGPAARESYTLWVAQVPVSRIPGTGPKTPAARPAHDTEPVLLASDRYDKSNHGHQREGCYHAGLRLAGDG